MITHEHLSGRPRSFRSFIKGLETFSYLPSYRQLSGNSNARVLPGGWCLLEVPAVCKNRFIEEAWTTAC